MYNDICIEHVFPSVDGGKRAAVGEVGDHIRVSAKIYSASHQVLRSIVKVIDSKGNVIKKTFMNQEKEDRFTATFEINKPGIYSFQITAWIDRTSKIASGIISWIASGENISSDLKELISRVDKMEQRAKGRDKRKFGELRTLLNGRIDETSMSLLQENFIGLFFKYDERLGETSTKRMKLLIYDRVLNRAWYEAFPRSQPEKGQKSGSFKSLVKELPRISRMGFDILYLPPISPIGYTNRRGRNGLIPCKKDDPGSPWAIGNHTGGHMDIHQDLGGFGDFEELLTECKKYGMDVALDIAFQCSPDHPYVKNHPEWFQRRNDGTIRYAENPPKKYYDIYPFEFYCSNSDELWNELKSIFMFWREKGVRFFRVDNPHTKPLGFWEWVISEVKEKYPDTYFLCEAFTTENLMYGLSKVGFDLSYSYFTWKNYDWEIKEYFKFLNRDEIVSFYTPVLFTNTPDILSFNLQRDGRPQFIIRSILGATLGSSWGIYSGYEICENDAIPGREEYLNSEKYEIKRRTFNSGDSIADEISTLNRIRREYRQLTERGNLTFLNTTNQSILAYSRGYERNKLVIILNLDPEKVQEGLVQVPEEWSSTSLFRVIDLYNQEAYTWSGGQNFVKLTPEFKPVHILKRVNE